MRDLQGSVTGAPSALLARVRFGAVCGLSLIAAALGTAPAASATTPEVTIMSAAGPLNDIYVGNELSCQVSVAGDPAYEFFPSSAAPGDCGTFVSTMVAGTSELYGPDFANHADSAAAFVLPSAHYTAFTPVSQPASASGSGTSSDPYTLTTSVSVPNTPLTISEVDSYVTGADSYRTDVTLSNPSGTAVSGLLYRGGDCYLQGSDDGYGLLDSASNATACLVNDNDSPAGPIEEFAPITGGVRAVEASYDSVWADIGDQTDLPDTCDCEVTEDNGMAIDWDFDVPAGGSSLYSSVTDFSQDGALALSASSSADSGTASPGSTDGYTVTIANPDPAAVDLSEITDTLPAGFTYRGGSTSGATTSDPAVNGSELTWSGSFAVPSGGATTLHFGVTVAGSPATYTDSAAAEATGYTVSDSGQTAPITVAAPAVVSNASSTTAAAATSSVAATTSATKTTTATTTTSAAKTTTATTTTATPPPPPPVLYKEVNVEPVSGTVLIKLPPGATLARASRSTALSSATKGVGFIPLTRARQIPTGSVLDTTGGTVAITAATTKLGTFSVGNFTAGVFALLQPRKDKGISQLNIIDGRRRDQACSSVGKQARVARKLNNTVLGLLKSTDHGRFTTSGDYSSATVRGTAYSVENTCAGTLTTVTRDSVVVDDFRRHRMIIVRAGHAFLATASGQKGIETTIGKRASIATAVLRTGLPTVF